MEDFKENRVIINQDLFCIENIEPIYQNIIKNCNLQCPFSGKLQELSDCDLKQIVAIYSSTLHKYFICMKKSIQEAHQNLLSAKLTNLYELVLFSCEKRHSIRNLQNYEQSGEQMAVVWEFYHPISNFQYCKLEKVVQVIRNGKDEQLFWNLVNLGACYYEPNIVVLPYNHVRSRLQVIDFNSQSRYEFHLILDVEKEQTDNQQLIELLYQDEVGNRISVFIDVVRQNDELFTKTNYKVGDGQGSDYQKVYNKNKNVPPGLQVQNHNDTNCILIRNITIKVPLKQNNKKQSSQQKPKKYSMAYEMINEEGYHETKKVRRETMQCQSEYQEQQQKSTKRTSRMNINSALYSKKIKEEEDSKQQIQVEQGNEEEKELINRLDEQKGLDYEQIRNKVVRIGRLAQGSRVMQKVVGQMNSEQVGEMINEIGDQIGVLMLDYYGNYMVQSLLAVCDDSQRLLIVQKIQDKVGEMGFDKIGTHALQRLVGLGNQEQEKQIIIKGVNRRFKELCFNNNGTHLVQKIIGQYEFKYWECLYIQMMKQFVEYCNNNHALCVVKQMMTKCPPQDIIKQIAENVEILIQNPYGNYAIQQAYECYEYQQCQVITERILSKIVQFSSQKFSSNVVEKLVSQYHEYFIDRFVEELKRNEQIRDLMRNKYGSLILMKLLSIVESMPQHYEHHNLQEQIRRNLGQIHSTGFRSKWQSFLEGCQNQYMFPLSNLSKMFQQLGMQ